MIEEIAYISVGLFLVIAIFGAVMGVHVSRLINDREYRESIKEKSDRYVEKLRGKYE